MALMAMEPLSAFAQKDKKAVDNRMTYRVQHGSGEQISLLGFGMMRLPNNQEEVNQLKDTIAELRKQVREQKKVIRELSKGV